MRRGRSAMVLTDWVNGHRSVIRTGVPRHIDRNSKYQHNHHLLLIGCGNCLDPMDLESRACRFRGRKQAIRGVGE